MLDVKSYVRDFYAYRRSQCPEEDGQELILKKMDKQLGLEKLQKQVHVWGYRNSMTIHYQSL